MKKELLLLAFLVALFSCSKDDPSTSQNTEIDLVTQKFSVEKLSDYDNVSLEDLQRDFGNRGVSMVCAGECGCTGFINMDTGQGGCTCSPCTMTITFHDKNVINPDLKAQRVYSSLLDSSYFKMIFDEYEEFLSTNFNLDKTNTFKNIDLHFGDKNIVASFTFIDDKGFEDNVLVVYEIGANRGLGSTYTVSCSGECGCTAGFDFNNNTATCSCSPCTMTVNQIKK